MWTNPGRSDKSLQSDARIDASGEKPVHSVFIPLITPFLYGMERVVIDLFDALRPEVAPYFLQSSRIYHLRPPIICEMERRGFSIALLPDKNDWERLAKPKSLKHFCQMIAASIRSNVAIFKGVRGKDALYVPSISAGSCSLLATLYCRVTGRRVIHHFHDLGTNNRLFPLWIPLVTDFVHNTEFGLKEIASALPAIERKRNFVVPCFVKPEGRIQEDPDAKGVLEGKRNLFFVGQVSRHKGVDLLVKAFALIAREHTDVALHLVGGFNEDFRSELNQQITAAGITERVRFWGYRTDAPGLLRSAYLYIQSSPPSRFHDCSPLSVIEAMAMRIPTICFRSGALPEMVLHEKTGLVCDESATALAQAMTRMLIDTKFRDVCAAAARQRYEQVWSPQRIRESWVHLLASGKNRVRVMTTIGPHETPRRPQEGASPHNQVFYEKEKNRVAYNCWHQQRAVEESSQGQLLHPWHRNVVRLLPDLSGTRVLEIGCGRGDFSVWLTQKYPLADVTGIDFSDEAIALASAKLSHNASLRFLVNDAENLNFPAETFDYIISCECLEHVPHPEKMAREMARVLKHGGGFILTTENYFNGMLLSWLDTLLKGRRFDSGSGVQPIEHFFVWWRVKRELERGGLRVEHMESNHFQWLLLPRTAPNKLCTEEFRSVFWKRVCRPFGRHFTYQGSRA